MKNSRDADVSRTTSYWLMTLCSTLIWLAGLSPIATQDKDVLSTLGLLGVGLCLPPFLVFRSKTFYRMIGGANKAGLVSIRWHRSLFKAMLAISLAAACILVVGFLQGWIAHTKIAILLGGGLFFFHSAGWLIETPRFVSRMNRRE